jgi:zinc transport system substrate-binding protein
MKMTLRVVMICALCAILACCGKKDREGTIKEGLSGKRITVYVTSCPLYVFTKRIGDGFVEVINPLPEGADPSVWMPEREVIEQYQQKADLIIINGASYEKWIDKVALPEEKVVNTAMPFESEFIRIKGVVTHSHGKSGKHSHEGIDGHTWLDPVLARTQSEVIKDALVAFDRKHAGKYEENFRGLRARLDLLDAELRILSNRYRGQVFAASHPAYNYLARRYGWKVKSFEFSPEAVPDEYALEHFEDFVSRNRVKYIIWEEYPSENVENYFSKKFGIKSVEFSPAENPAGREEKSREDYFSIMEKNIKNIEGLFE